MNHNGSILWDVPTRLIHWGIVACIVLNLWVVEEGSDLHDWIGYVAAGLVGMRVIWGFVGGTSSRFTSFPLHFKHLKEFVTKSSKGEPIDYPGHNPLASYLYLALWTLVIGLAITGWMMSLDAFWGEEWLEEIHEVLSMGLIAFLGMHMAGMLIDAFQHKRRTWMGMLTGKRD